MAESAIYQPSWLDKPEDVNVLTPGLWPLTARRQEELSIGGMAVSELAAAFGTPLYVLDQADLQARAQNLKQSFEAAFEAKGLSVGMYYACKAFLNTWMARFMANLGYGLDVCSAGEIAVALRAGVPAGQLGFHGNNKSAAEIEYAVEAGVGVINLDSLIELERVAAAAKKSGKRQAVRLRAATGVEADTHEHLLTAAYDQKFGIALKDIPSAAARIMRDEHLLFLGLHCHVGSQIFTEEAFVESIARLMAVHRQLLSLGTVTQLNLGGGFGAPYTAADPQLNIAELAEKLAAAAARACEGIEPPKFVFEPGRTLIGPAMIALYEVGTVKDVQLADGRVRKYVSVDGGMSDNARPALYDAQYSALLASRTSAAPPALSRVCGKHCESGDNLVKFTYLPEDIAPTDLVAIPVCGAYNLSLASNYNYLPRPAVAVVHEGQARLIVRRETITDMLVRDLEESEF